MIIYWKCSALRASALALHGTFKREVAILLVFAFILKFENLVPHLSNFSCELELKKGCYSVEVTKIGYQKYFFY